LNLNFLWLKSDNESFAVRKSAFGSIEIIPSVDFLEVFLRVALKKYERMHCDSPKKRLDKSWTGYVGEIIVSCVVKKLKPALEFLKVPILPNEPQALEVLMKDLEKEEDCYYDEGDLWIKLPSRESKLIINVSSRKLSGKDKIENAIKFPQNYICLIPVDQINQYTKKANFCFFCFLIPLRSKSFSIPFQSDCLFVELPVSWNWIVPGFLTASDLSFMVQNFYLFKFQR